MSDTHPKVLSMLRALLPVMDNLERGLQAAKEPEAETSSAVQEGIRGIHRQLTDLLYQYNVRSFTSLGRPFDPSKHEAMAQIHTNDVPVNHVAEEIRRGYLLEDDLFRPAQVMVNMGAAAGKPAPQGKRVHTGNHSPATRSTESRPSWLLHPPPETNNTVFIIGHHRGAKSVEAGEAAAKDMLLPDILRCCAGYWPDYPLKATFERLARSFKYAGADGAWGRMTEVYPTADTWIEDLFWEKLSSEIGGTIYDVAILAAVHRDELGEIYRAKTPEERWGGMVFSDMSPLLKAVLPDVHGGVLMMKSKTGQSYRYPVVPGDVVVGVGNRSSPDAATVRRLLTLQGHGRRPFDLTIARGVEEPIPVRIELRNASARQR